MLYGLFWSLIAMAALMMIALTARSMAYRTNFDLGAHAERMGLPMNTGWSAGMKDGWAHSWRARHGLNDLGEEVGRYGL
jgi:hypothetical protein